MYRAQARRRAATASGSGVAGARGRELPASDESLQVTPSELEEFLAADREPVDANPAFRKKLRARLWKLLRTASPRGS